MNFKKSQEEEMQFLSIFIADQKRWILKKNMIIVMIMIQIVNYLVLLREMPPAYWSQTDIISVIVQCVDDPFFFLNYMLTAILFATEYCKQKENHFLQFCMIRSSEIQYILSKIVNSFLAAFTTMSGGMILWILSLRTFIPWGIVGVGQYDICLDWGMGELLRKQDFIVYFLLISIGLGLLAGVLSLFSFTCSLVIPSQTLVVIIPTLCLYLTEALIGDHFPNLYQWIFYQIFFYPYNHQNQTQTILMISFVYTICCMILSLLCCYIIVKIQKKQEKWYVS